MRKKSQTTSHILAPAAMAVPLQNDRDIKKKSNTKINLSANSYHTGARTCTHRGIE